MHGREIWSIILVVIFLLNDVELPIQGDMWHGVLGTNVCVMDRCDCDDY